MADEMTADERREFERKPLTIEIRFEGGSMTGTAMTRDIGFGGLYMATKLGFPVNTLLKLLLRLGERDLEIDGIVAYQDFGQGVGIRFQNLSAEIEEILRRELPAKETAEIKIGTKQMLKSER